MAGNRMRAAFESRADQDGRNVVGVTAGTASERSTPVKLSVSLEAPVYRRLLIWLAQQTGVVGRKVDSTKVGAALFAELLDSPELAERVMTRVREQMRS